MSCLFGTGGQKVIESACLADDFFIVHPLVLFALCFVGSKLMEIPYIGVLSRLVAICIVLCFEMLR